MLGSWYSRSWSLCCDSRPIVRSTASVFKEIEFFRSVTLLSIELGKPEFRSYRSKRRTMGQKEVVGFAGGSAESCYMMPLFRTATLASLRASEHLRRVQDWATWEHPWQQTCWNSSAKCHLMTLSNDSYTSITVPSQRLTSWSARALFLPPASPVQPFHVPNATHDHDSCFHLQPVLTCIVVLQIWQAHAQ